MSMSVFHSIFFSLKTPSFRGVGREPLLLFQFSSSSLPMRGKFQSLILFPHAQNQQIPPEKKWMQTVGWNLWHFLFFRNILYLPSPGRFHICPMPWNSLFCFTHLAFLIVSKKRMVCYKLLHHKQTQKSIVWVLGSPCYGNQGELPEDICSENTHWWPYPRVSITGCNHNSSKLQQNIDQPFTFLHLIYKDIICSS